MYYIILKYRKSFNNLTVTSNTRLEISFQVQKKFQSHLKSYNGGITLAWAILVDKDKFNIKKHKKKHRTSVCDVCQADRLAMRRPHQLDSDSPQQKLDRRSSRQLELQTQSEQQPRTTHIPHM